jgi:hypothetical protein
VPPEADAPAHWLHANGEALPRFALAREAGIRKAVLIGSFYPHVAPELPKAIRMCVLAIWLAREHAH